MLGLTLDQATTIAAVVVGALLVLAVVSAWVMKGVVQKIALVVILGLLAVLVWSQRSSLQECADRVRTAGVGASGIDTTCTFFGRDIDITLDRNGT